MCQLSLMEVDALCWLIAVINTLASSSKKIVWTLKFKIYYLKSTNNKVLLSSSCSERLWSVPTVVGCVDPRKWRSRLQQLLQAELSCSPARKQTWLQQDASIWLSAGEPHFSFWSVSRESVHASRKILSWYFSASTVSHPCSSPRVAWFRHPKNILLLTSIKYITWH